MKRDYPRFLKVIALSHCVSTNTYLRTHYEQLKHDLPVLVTSALQTGGRGRDQRTWVSPEGKGLYSSFGFYLHTRQNLNLLPLIAGLSVIETLKRISGVEPGLKWPNDVLWKEQNQKIAGILIENVIMEKRLFCVAGIGINLNHSIKDFPAELEGRAVSLKIAVRSRRDFSVKAVNPVLSHTFFQWLERLANNEKEIIVQTANRYSEFLLNQPITFHHQGGIITGMFKGIHDDGGLKLGNERGDVSIYYTGEVETKK
jgi:BirA family biotin operon repressor/biotin-[acetyl-CoA-carboxylase] ligase